MEQSFKVIGNRVEIRPRCRHHMLWHVNELLTAGRQERQRPGAGWDEDVALALSFRIGIARLEGQAIGR